MPAFALSGCRPFKVPNAVHSHAIARHTGNTVYSAARRYRWYGTAQRALRAATPCGQRHARIVGRFTWSHRFPTSHSWESATDLVFRAASLPLARVFGRPGTILVEESEPGTVLHSTVRAFDAGAATVIVDWSQSLALGGRSSFLTRRHAAHDGAGRKRRSLPCAFTRCRRPLGRVVRNGGTKIGGDKPPGV